MLYFACDWIGSYKTQKYVFFSIFIAKDLQCEFIMLRDIQKNEEDYLFCAFAVKAPSKAKFDEFVAKTGYRTGMTDWYPISKFEYREDFELDVFDNFILLDNIGKYLRSISYRNEINTNEKLQIPIDDLNLSTSIIQTLQTQDVNTLGDYYAHIWGSKRGIDGCKIDLDLSSSQAIARKLRIKGFDTISVISFIPFVEDVSHPEQQHLRSILNRYNQPLPEYIPTGRVPSNTELQLAALNLVDYKVSSFELTSHQGYFDILVEKDEEWAIIQRSESPKDDGTMIVYSATGQYPIAKAIAQQIANICGSVFLSDLGLIIELVLPE